MRIAHGAAATSMRTARVMLGWNMQRRTKNMLRHPPKTKTIILRRFVSDMQTGMARRIDRQEVSSICQFDRRPGDTSMFTCRPDWWAAWLSKPAKMSLE